MDADTGRSDSLLEKMRRTVTLEESTIETTRDVKSSRSCPGYDDHWSLSRFKKTLHVSINGASNDFISFDIVNIPTPIVNAFRRILIAEVPTMAIEKVFIYKNGSIMQDEILAHRLGLVPIFADPEDFAERDLSSVDGNEADTLEFHLHVKCTMRPDKREDSCLPDDKYFNRKVISGHLKWAPFGAQAQRFSGKEPHVINDDILLLKMIPGQEIELKAHACKGVGRDHAKFSPVCTASYRLLPEVVIKRPVVGSQAELLQSCFAKGVIGIEKSGGQKKAVVLDSRCDTGNREHMNYPELKDSVEVRRVKEHFIFSIESTGAISPDELMLRSIRLLRAKCVKLIDACNKIPTAMETSTTEYSEVATS